VSVDTIIDIMDRGVWTTYAGNIPAPKPNALTDKGAV